MKSIGDGYQGLGGPLPLLFHWQRRVCVCVSHLSEEDFQVLHLQREINSEQRLSKLSAVVSPEINCCRALRARAATM